MGRKMIIWEIGKSFLRTLVTVGLMAVGVYLFFLSLQLFFIFSKPFLGILSFVGAWILFPLGGKLLDRWDAE